MKQECGGFKSRFTECVADFPVLMPCGDNSNPEVWSIWSKNISIISHLNLMNYSGHDLKKKVMKHIYENNTEQSFFETFSDRNVCCSWELVMNEAAWRGGLWGFYTGVSQYDLSWKLPFCTKRLSKLWWLLRTWRKGKAVLVSELTRTSQAAKLNTIYPQMIIFLTEKIRCLSPRV